VAIVRVAIVPGGNYPRGGNCPGGNCPVTVDGTLTVLERDPRRNFIDNIAFLGVSVCVWIEFTDKQWR
jgi:hypothetical protein